MMGQSSAPSALPEPHALLLVLLGRLLLLKVVGQQSLDRLRAATSF